MFTDSHDWCNFRNRTEWKQALQSRKKIIQMHELKFTFFPLLFLFFFLVLTAIRVLYLIVLDMVRGWFRASVHGVF